MDMRYLLFSRGRQHRSTRVRLALVAPGPRCRGYGQWQKRPSLAPSSPGGGPCTGRLSMDLGDLADFGLWPSACHASTSTPYSGIDCSSCLVSPCRGPLKQWPGAYLLGRPGPRRGGRVGRNGHEPRQARHSGRADPARRHPKYSRPGRCAGAKGRRHHDQSQSP